MTLPDITPLSLSELRDLISAATDAYRAAEAAAQEESDDRRLKIGRAIESLNVLLGSEGSPPYDPVTGENATIIGVLAHDSEDHAVLAQNAGLALSLILRGMKANVSTVLDLAHVIGKDA